MAAGPFRVGLVCLARELRRGGVRVAVDRIPGRRQGRSGRAGCLFRNERRCCCRRHSQYGSDDDIEGLHVVIRECLCVCMPLLEQARRVVAVPKRKVGRLLPRADLEEPELFVVRIKMRRSGCSGSCRARD